MLTIAGGIILGVVGLVALLFMAGGLVALLEDTQRRWKGRRQ